MCPFSWIFDDFPRELKETDSSGARKLWTQKLVLQLHIHFTCPLSLCIANLQHCDGDLSKPTTKRKLKSSGNWVFDCEMKKNYRAQTPENLALATILQKFKKTSTPLDLVIIKRIAVTNLDRTRLHSSRMRTARALTVSPSMLFVGGVCTGGLSAPGVGWGCLLPGVYLLPGGCIPACTEADTPLWTEFLTHTYENITLPGGR